ncbi:MAG: pyridoxine 5'-phosphate synthase [Vampirovibrionales bacterium]|nr:pyridoxine 5'-phosphate synthase [Vampirovibrionales bacterium]
MAYLGVNIDHVATVRNARGTVSPDPIQAALLAEANGADGITAHLREDRRHITDRDIERLKVSIKTRLNMEMAATEEMLAIACHVKPYMCTLVPERREELTTEGGLDVVTNLSSLKPIIQGLQKSGIRVSLFIDGNLEQVEASKASAADIVEFHTGKYCDSKGKSQQQELSKLIEAAGRCVSLGIEVNAGHGLNYDNVKPILAMPGLYELNIGHSIVSEALYVGFPAAVRRMKDLIQ